MAPVANKGIRLCRAENSETTKYGWILRTVTVLAVYCALVIATGELTGFQKIYSPAVMLLSGACVCIFSGVLDFMGKKHWFYPGILMLVLLIVLVFGNQIHGGICLFWNQFSDTWTANTGWVIPELEAGVAVQNSGICLMLFSVVFGGVAAVLCCWMLEYVQYVFAAIIPALLLFVVGGMHIQLSNVSLILVMASVVAMYVSFGWDKHDSKPAAPILASWIVCGVFACFLLVVSVTPDLRNWADEINRGIDESLHHSRYETKYSTLPEGDFTDYKKETGKPKKALVVTMEKAEPLFLKGFVGTNFENNRWAPLDTQTLADNKGLLYWLNLEEFYPNAQFSAAAMAVEAERNQITVQNIGACSQYVYMPFTVHQDSVSEIIAPEYLGTETVTNVTGNIDRTYLFSTWYDGTHLMNDILDQLQTSKEESILRYRQAESAYREFVYAHYLQIPQNVIDLMGEMLDEFSQDYASDDGMTRQQAQNCAMDFLRACFPETGTPENLKLPLDSARGTCYQYATVAVMTLRYYGIPARYAEGYRITEEMIEEEFSNESVTVDSGDAWAWVEVYQDGLGWLPLDVTPGLEAMAGTSQTELSGTYSDDAKLQTKPGKELEKDQENEPEKEPDGGTMVMLEKTVELGALLMIPVLLLLLLIVYLRRRLLLRKRDARFQNTDTREAIGWIYRDVSLLLSHLGLDRGNGSMRNLCDTASEWFGSEYGQAFDTMTALNSEALFSSHMIEEDKRADAIAFHEKTVLLLQSNLKWSKRLRIKWIQCLY